MKADLEIQILDRLLDKYERSSFFREGQPPTRRILLKFYDNGATDFPSYDIEVSQRREEINQAVNALAAQGLVCFQWMKGEAGHILAKVWLEPEAIPMAYLAAGRRPRLDLMEELQEELLALYDQLSLDWTLAYCEEMLQRIAATKKIPALLPQDPLERAMLFKVLRGLQQEKGQAITARVFSMKYLGDSKAFETRTRPRLLSILRHCLEHDDDTRDDDLLGQVGIVRYPEQFEFRGNLSFVSIAAETDFSALRYGSSISAADLTVGTLRVDKTVTRVLSIENRANYFAALESHNDPGEIILYHGGQYSPGRKVFFQALMASLPKDAQWLHWGDLDYGGFSMLARLRREIDPNIQGYRMDLKEISAHRQRCVSITEDYAQRLLLLAGQPELADFKETLHYLAAQRIRLEQEALLFT